MVVITIDTVKDSPEELRKTIRYLESLVNDSSGRGEASGEEGLGADEGLLNMFGGGQPGSGGGESDREGLDEPSGEGKGGGSSARDQDAFIEIVEYE